MDQRSNSSNYKVLGENTGINLHDPGLGKGFLNDTNIASNNNKNIDKLISSKLKFLYFKGHCQKKVKGLTTEWKKIFANDICDKGVVSILYKALYNSTIKKTYNSIFKWTKHSNRHFSKEDL